MTIMRPRVAYLSSANTLPGSPTRRHDAWEHDLTIGMLGMGLQRIERTIEPVRWDDATIDFSAFEAAMIGTTWDYADRSAEFIDALQCIASQTRVLNAPATVQWNMRKTYLRDMAGAGCETIPTLWLDRAEERACRAAFDQFGCEQIVIKPQIGAGAWRQVRLQRDQAWPDAQELPPDATMVQPYLPNIASEGEYSFLYFHRQFSHAVKKCAAAGDYRIQSTYGGSDQPHTPTADDLAIAEHALQCVDDELLYARVDLVRGDDGRLKLMELEIIEPYLYPVHAPQMGLVFADAYAKLMRI
jgi:glutathione synthase/RimK-type ligase-like ATP-grasp enzyme